MNASSIKITDDKETLAIEVDEQSEIQSSAPPVVKSEEGSLLIPRVIVEGQQPYKSDSWDDGMTCSICLEHWTNYGEHCVCSLDCGHIFGLKCIEGWLSNHQRLCPTCEDVVLTDEIRIICPPLLVTVDPIQYENIIKELDAANEMCFKLNSQLNLSILRMSTLLRKLSKLTRAINSLKLINK